MAGSYRVFIPAVWSKFIQFYFEKKLFAQSFFKDYSADVILGGDDVNIPHIATVDAGTLTHTSGAITDNIVSETRSILSINTWAYKSRKFSDFYMAQIATKYSIQAAYAQTLAESIRRKIDTDLLAEGTNIYPRVGNSATNLGTTTIEGGIRILESYSIPQTECAFFFHGNAFWGELMQNQKYYDASQWGRPVAAGGQAQPVGNLYGIPVYVSAQVPVGTDNNEGGHRNLLVHNSRIVFALGNLTGTPGMPRTTVEGVADARATRVMADIMYGVKTTDNEGGVRIISNT